MSEPAIQPEDLEPVEVTEVDTETPPAPEETTEHGEQSVIGEAGPE